MKFQGEKKKMNVKKNQKFRTSLFDVIDLIVLKRSYWILYKGIFDFKIIQFKNDNHLINSIDMDTNFNNFFIKLHFCPLNKMQFRLRKIKKRMVFMLKQTLIFTHIDVNFF